MFIPVYDQLTTLSLAKFFTNTLFNHAHLNFIDPSRFHYPSNNKALDKAPSTINIADGNLCIVVHPSLIKT